MAGTSWPDAAPTFPRRPGLDPGPRFFPTEVRSGIPDQVRDDGVKLALRPLRPAGRIVVRPPTVMN
ncbi:hypothetical protein SPHINGO8AM_130043 [Sphingomonas sp. 8AM]|nr:hypothetical protein SPHINGO8AM_130043 [Sphingomonas sp. 8AM]